MRCLLAVALLCSLSLQTLAATEEEQLLQKLPAAELTLKDTVDHWGLPFSDQLRRFTTAQATFRTTLGTAAPKGFMVGLQHGLEKVPRNKYWFKGQYGTSLSLTAARNEAESFQVAVLPDIGTSLGQVTLTATDLRQQKGDRVIPAANLTVYRVAYVNTPAAPYPSLYTGAWPDGLLPNGPVKIDGTDLGLFWVEVRVPRDAEAGEYQGQLQLQADGQSLPIRLTLRVYPFTLSDRVPLPVVVWTSPQWPGGKKMTAEDYRRLAAMFLEHGVDPASIGKAFVSLEKNDFQQLDENLEFCFARGLQIFEIPNSAAKPEKLRTLVDHLRQKGWLQKALVYSNRDEPNATQFAAENVPWHEKMKSLYPDLRVYLASEYHAGIDRACDVWMTDLSTGKGPAFAAANRGRADLWFYYCHLPIHIDYYRPLVQAPNMQIDNEAIEHRLAPWLAWKYQTPGMFIWAGNQEWLNKEVDRRDWETAGWQLPDKPTKFPYGGIHNGNGYLIYPGPLPSIRLKVLRDGLEDYGYLLELKRRAAASPKKDLVKEAQQMLAVPASVLVDPHYFNRNPTALLETRQKMAELIEALGDTSQAR